MSHSQPRVAFFPDAFHEVDGVATVGRRFQAFTAKHDLPFLMVHSEGRHAADSAPSRFRLGLQRSPIKFPLDQAHEFDLLFLRHYRRAAALLREFQPDLIQITGPSDVGILGAMLAYRLKIPLAAFWQTNLHQYAGLRAAKALSILPAGWRAKAAGSAERWSLLATTRFYRIPKLLFAPNPELVQMLRRQTGQPCFPMAHAVDTDVFSPAFRDRQNGPFTLGYVGRLSSEKNVRALALVERALLQKGITDFRIVIVGEGAETGWLRDNLKHAEIRGVLTGRELSRAFANLDVLLFPSETDTFGLVVLEALASGVPAIVTASGGPKFTVQHGRTGYVADTMEACLPFLARLMEDAELLASMRKAAREYALSQSWDHVFTEIYNVYKSWLDPLPFAGNAHRAPAV